MGETTRKGKESEMSKLKGEKGGGSESRGVGKEEEGGERNERKEERSGGGELGETWQYQPHTQVVIRPCSHF